MLSSRPQIKRDYEVTVHLKLEEGITAGVVWDRYKEYGKWCKENLVLFWPSYEVNHFSLPLYYNFHKAEDALAFRLKFGL